jgi:hypothetical protein
MFIGQDEGTIEHQSLCSTERRRPYLEAVIERYTGGVYEQPDYRLGTTDMALHRPKSERLELLYQVVGEQRSR